VNSSSIRAGLRLAFCLISVTACCAEVPEAHVNPVPLKLPVDSAADIRFAHISTAQGLSQIRVMSMVQDDQGFMWFGTLYGLNRFDGYTFKVYMHERGNPNSLSGVDVESLFKDRDGALWIGCEQALDHFDPKTEAFTHFPVPKVKQITQDRAGLLWLSTDRGLYRLDPKSGKIRVYTHNPNDPESLPDNHVVAAAEDKTGRFWVGEPYGIYEFDRVSGHVKLSVPLHTASRDLSFYEDSLGGFWIIYGTGNGLAKFDRERNTLTYYSFKPGDLSSTAYIGVDAMLEDRHGNLWLAKQGFGLLKLDREHNRFLSYTRQPGDANSLADVNVIALYEDRDGSIWASLPGDGLQRFSPVPLPFQPLLVNQKKTGAGCFYEDSHRNLWTGQGAGLYRISPSGKTTVFSGIKPGGPFDPLSVVEDHAGFIWVGTSNNGLFRLNPNSGQWKNYRHNESDPSSLSNNVVYRLMVDYEGTLWAATWDGIDRFDPQTDRFTTFKANPNAREQIYLAIVEDSRHNFWLGTNGFGLQYFNPKTGQFTVFNSSDAPGGLSDSSVMGLYIARNRTIWMGTPNGLNELDSATKRFTVYNTLDGVASGAVGCVLEDSRGKLWISSTKGISSFDPSTKTFRNFSTAEGLPGPEMASTGACLRTASGRMYFSGFSGATTFLPEAIPDDNYAPPTVITDFQLLGDTHLPASEIAPQAISFASAITLSHKQSTFSLTFAALAYSDSLTNRYRYKLEGLDNSWTEVGSGGRTVTYSSLPAKKYRFRVQGATNSSRWSEPGAELEIVILPPWWNTWWFRTAYALAALLVIWSAYRYRMRQIARQLEIRIDAQVNERTRIARELHDTMLQSFQGLLLRFQTVLNLLPARPEEAMLRIEGVIEEGSNAITEGRDAVHELRSMGLEIADLAQSIRDFAKELLGNLSSRNLPQFHVQMEGTPRDLNPVVRDESYRITAEALRNAIRHAEAQQIEVEIRYDQEQLKLRIRDDGKGIDAGVLEKEHAPGHWGLRGMRERAKVIGGSFEVWSKQGSGTEIELKIPATSAYAKPSPSRGAFFSQISRR
jgi:signal transduction histidine kinase/ligand-binding sensor domain-containing protein